MRGLPPQLLPEFRPGGAKDVERTLEHLSRSSPYSYGPQNTGPAIVACLQRLLEERTLLAPLLEDRAAPADRGKAHPLLAFGVTAFLGPQTAEGLLREPPELLVDVVLQRELEGEKLLLREPEVARLNPTGELSLLFLAYAPPVGDPNNPTVRRLVALTHEMFQLFHSGYYCCRAIHPSVPSEEGMQTLLQMGFLPVGRPPRLLVHDLQGIDRAPYHPLVLLRQGAAPVLELPAGERDMLLRALCGRSDVELARDLGIGGETIRKRWRRIFERFQDSPAGTLLSARIQASDGYSPRGSEKRGVVLRYVAAHLEELRPYAHSKDTRPVRVQARGSQ